MKRDVQQVAYKTVDTFSGILDRKLWLRDGLVVATNGNRITVPFKHPHFYRMIEKCLAHIVFESDAETRERFAHIYSMAIYRQAERVSVGVDHRRLRKTIIRIIGVLENERVFANWGRIYTGSANDLREIWKAQAREFPQDELICAMMRAGTGERISGNFLKYKSAFIRAFRKVRGRDFQAVLLVAKWLLISLVDIEASKTTNLRKRAKALNRILNFCVEPGTDEQINDWKPSNLKTEEDETGNTEDKVGGVMGQDVTQEEKLDELLKGSEKQVDKIVSDLLAAGNREVVGDDYMRTVPAKVVFHDVVSEKSDKLIPEDEYAIRQLRTRFFRVMGRKRMVLEETGLQPDLSAVVRRIVSGRLEPIFIGEARCRGFRALILRDLSTSMKVLADQLNRACKIVSRALDFPFTETHVWGFQALGHGGRVDITRFPPGATTFDVDKSKFSGLTPLHIAIRVSATYLKQGTEKSHLFVISDGLPCFTYRDNELLPTKQLKKLTSREVRNARRAGIGVTGLLISTEEHDETEGAVSPDDMQAMFGPSNTWRILKKDSFGSDIVGLVSSSFESYLKNG